MGSPADETWHFPDETQHQVKLTKGFYLGKCLVTQAQWEKVMGHNPAFFKNAGKDAPVEAVLWGDCQAFCGKLGEGFRLPTEAEWEYACRAGTQTALNSGKALTVRGDYNGPELDEVAWYGGNSGVEYAGGWDSSGWEDMQYKHAQAGTHPVGQKKPNAWGLYDMHGNVWEWCNDFYGDYPAGAATDPTGPTTGQDRVARGGGWCNFAGLCRSAARLSLSPWVRNHAVGMRLAFSLPPERPPDAK